VVGLGEVDSNTADPNSNPYLTEYYDDNFDDTNDATALATLTNSFADLIVPYVPDHSAGLLLCEPCADDNGCGVFELPGVNINMESDPGENRIGPQNDDFAGRQFLYPFVRVAGDFNADKSLTVEDVDLLLAEIRESVPPRTAPGRAASASSFAASARPRSPRSRSRAARHMSSTA
jgi:hypothetical protein